MLSSLKHMKRKVFVQKAAATRRLFSSQPQALADETAMAVAAWQRRDRAVDVALEGKTGFVAMHVDGCTWMGVLDGRFCVPVYLCTCMTTHVKRDILDNHFVCVG